MDFPKLNTKRILTETFGAINNMNIPASGEIDEGLGSIVAGLLGAGNADTNDQRTIISQINAIKQQDISQLNSLIRNMEKQKALLKKIPSASETDKKASIGKTVKDEITDLETKQNNLQRDIATIKSEIKVNEEKIKTLKASPTQDQTAAPNSLTEHSLEQTTALLPSFKKYLSK